ncbi:uncharacterized protein LOC141588774 [Silene latifolia]|uniref:uncharacterized protein LOC141588774 n=1 Tax=Silene latifolia TaxID=37657 RepID=UPI003D76A6F3
MVYTRLDRVLVNQSWLLDYPQSYAHFYCEGTFDHSPCVVQSKNDGGKKRRSFKYFNMWSQSVDFHHCVKENWEKNWPGTKMYNLVCKLKHLKGPLKNLNKCDFDDVENNSARAQMYLEKIQERLRDNPLNPELILQEREATSSVRFLNDACYEFLMQKYKAIWVEKGDYNTKYFYSIIKGRQVRNKIMRIADSNGILCETPDEIQNAFIAFYTNLLGSSHDTIDVAKMWSRWERDQAGDVNSIMVLLRSFATFSCASGLQMNSTKTNAYFNGVHSWVKQDIIQVSRFQEGHLPFKYLGVPITCGRMKKSDCNILVEKLVSKIRSFGTKKLSYLGKLILVNSVLTALYSYWINIFIIPKGALNKLNAICRNYL